MEFVIFVRDATETCTCCVVLLCMYYVVFSFLIVLNELTFHLTEKPVATMSCPSIVRLLEEQSFFCLCEDISNSEIAAQAMWLRNGQTLKNSRPFHEEELYLENVTSGDEGLYTCRVRTETAMVEISLEVFVLPGKMFFFCGLVP